MELLESLAETLESNGSRIVWLDVQQRVLKSTGSAQHVLGEAGVTYEIDQPMVVRNKQEDRELKKILRRALPPIGAIATAGSVIVTRPNGLPPLVLSVTPVSSDGNDHPASRVAALLLISDPQHGFEIDPKIIQSAFGITWTEAKVAVDLAHGKTVREIATSTGRVESTVRSHVKRILAKRELSRQADLILEVLSYGIGRRPG